MATGPVRDGEAVRAGLERWLREHHPDRSGLVVASFERASIGFSNETVVLDTQWDGGGEPIVVRLPAIEPVHPDPDLRVEAAVQSALARAGIPTPAPARFEADPGYVGVEFLVMPFVAGRVGPQTPGIDAWLTGLAPAVQRAVAGGFVDLLARLHRVDPASTGLAELLRGDGTSIADEVDWWRRYLGWAAGDEPGPQVVEDLLTWCAAHAPDGEPAPSVLWGDARLGNAIFAADGTIAAALDWDMAFLGPAEHDLGWYVGLDELTASLLGSRVPGFPTRGELVAEYEHRLGRSVVDLEWYEIFALVRSIAVAFRLWVLAATAGVPPSMPPPDQNPVVAYVQDLIARTA